MPFICQLITKAIFAAFADKAKQRGYGANRVTKICNLIGMCIIISSSSKKNLHSKYRSREELNAQK